MRPLLLTLALAACHNADTYSADVHLEIDGQNHDYSTTKVEIEHERRWSVYLLPEDKEAGQPYINLRYYSGNPVGHVWLRYTTDSEEFDHPPKWECFVPGVLSDGTETLTWKNDDGTDRHNTETGEDSCAFTVAETDAGLQVEFDVLLRPKDKKMKGEGDDDVTLRARGSADIQR